MSRVSVHTQTAPGPLLSEWSRHLRQVQREGGGEITGHCSVSVIASTFYQVCPTCRVTMTNCVSQVAATIIQRIQHPCDFRVSGCDTRCDINAISEHEESCRFRLVRCPHWACDDQVSVTHLTSHVMSAECSDNHMSKALPYQEEMEYTRALDDQEGNSNWRPSMLMYDDVTFYLQVEKQDKQWFFYVQMEGSAAECEKFETKLSVCKFPNSDRQSICYNGKVCPIDVKGML